MNTQEIWFPEYGTDWPSHGCITDGVEGVECAVIAYATTGHVQATVTVAAPRRSTLPRPRSAGDYETQQSPSEDETPIGPAGVRQLVIETSGPVTPEQYPHLYTVLDPGQAVPMLMHQAKALGFEVSYSLHGQNPDERITL